MMIMLGFISIWRGISAAYHATPLLCRLILVSSLKITKGFEICRTQLAGNRFCLMDVVYKETMNLRRFCSSSGVRFKALSSFHRSLILSYFRFKFRAAVNLRLSHREFISLTFTFDLRFC